MPTKAKEIEDGLELAVVLGGAGLALYGMWRAYQARNAVVRQVSIGAATTQNERVGAMLYDATHGKDYTGKPLHPTVLQAAEAFFVSPLTAYQAYEGYSEESDAQRAAARAARQAAREAAGSSSPSVQAAMGSGGASVSGQKRKPEHHWYDF